MRDLFVLAGLILLFAGLAGAFDLNVAMITIGSIIVVKGLVKWV